MKIIIVGGGIIGMSVGYMLCDKGHAVELFEKDKLGKKASFAAAGMLQPLAYCEEDEEFFSLCLKSFKMYPSFVLGLSSTLSIDDKGSIHVYYLDEEKQRLEMLHRIASKNDFATRMVSKEEVLAMEPAIDQNIKGGLYIPDAHVDNRALVLALSEKVKSSCTVHENTNVDSLIEKEGKVTGVKIGGEEHFSDIVINCCGAWSSALSPVSITPIKGHMLRMKADVSLSRYVNYGNFYVIPRDPGFVIGSTLEMDDFSDHVQPELIDRLHRSACRLIPQLEKGKIVESWTGLRPFSDEKPIIKKMQQGHYVCSGHYRNGILLAPLSARKMVELIEGECIAVNH